MTEGPLAELDDLIEILVLEGVRSYLEIGSATGSSLVRVAESLPPSSRVVCVDLPTGPNTLPMLKQSIHVIKGMGHDVTHVVGDSTDPHIVAQVRALGPFDAGFIDGDHSLRCVKADWKNYGPMCRLVAFHDIGWLPRPDKTPIEVPAVWAKVKKAFPRHHEIRRYYQKYGIGVVWRE